MISISCDKRARPAEVSLKYDSSSLKVIGPNESSVVSLKYKWNSRVEVQSHVNDISICKSLEGVVLYGNISGGRRRRRPTSNVWMPLLPFCCYFHNFLADNFLLGNYWVFSQRQVSLLCFLCVPQPLRDCKIDCLSNVEAVTKACMVRPWKRDHKLARSLYCMGHRNTCIEFIYKRA